MRDSRKRKFSSVYRIWQKIWKRVSPNFWHETRYCGKRRVFGIKLTEIRDAGLSWAGMRDQDPASRPCLVSLARAGTFLSGTCSNKWYREINLYLYRTVSKGMFNKTVERLSSSSNVSGLALHQWSYKYVIACCKVCIRHERKNKHSKITLYCERGSSQSCDHDQSQETIYRKSPPLPTEKKYCL